MAKKRYVHGYSERESERLSDQALTLTDLLHSDTKYPAGSKVLEAGCGIGAQTVILAKNSPGARVTSVDISPESVKQARERVKKEGITNVNIQFGDLFSLPFEPASFDHIFVCFVLEHLADPLLALQRLRPLLRDGGSITVIEGDHGSTFFYPESTEAHRAISCLVELQKSAGGDALIGRRLYPLVSSAGFSQVRISPRFVYVDASRPELVEGFTKQTFTAMVDGIRQEVLAGKMMSERDWEKGIRDLYRTCEADGVFCYMFFKATALK